jgi:hypothetical protein
MAKYGVGLSTGTSKYAVTTTQSML